MIEGMKLTCLSIPGVIDGFLPLAQSMSGYI